MHPKIKKGISHQELLEVWRGSLTQDNSSDPVDVVVSELSEYFQMPPDEVKKRCINWEDDSLKEWQAKNRSTPEGLIDFYQTQVSWIFDTMWYHAQQYHGEAPSENVFVMEFVAQHLTPGKMLDFGAGPGSSALFFHELGWDVSLADISTTMLQFARWRLQKHHVSASFYELTTDELPEATFDLITAFDVMVHVPNIAETLKKLRRALKPGGYLIFNIDNRPLTPKTEWHLYQEQYPILGQIRTIGFRRHPKISFFHCYQKVDRSATNTFLIRCYDQVRYNRYITAVGNPIRRILYKLQPAKSSLIHITRNLQTIFKPVKGNNKS